MPLRREKNRPGSIDWLLYAAQSAYEARRDWGSGTGFMYGGMRGAASIKNGLNFGDEFIASAIRPWGNQGLTTVGRALQKHAGREGSIFRSIRFSHKTANQDGLHILRQIITSPNKVIQRAENGGFLIKHQEWDLEFREKDYLMVLENYLNRKYMKNEFQIIIGSPIDYEELVAYIVIDGEHVALLNQDEGKDKIKIEFFDEPKLKEIYLDIFIEAIQEAKRELIGNK